MSCRVLAGSVTARSLFVAVAATDLPGLSLAHTQADPGSPPEITALHARIVELEQALQGDVRKAREAGYREGEAAGRERAAAELAPVLQRLSASIAGLAALRPRVRRDAEQELVQLSIAIARRIVRRELSVDPDAVSGLVKSALEKIQPRDICRVRAHPHHVSAIRKYLEHSPAGAGVEVSPDGGLQPGDVVVETRRGDLDGSVETQLAEIERGFADRLGR